jgi:hypothetical protein
MSKASKAFAIKSLRDLDATGSAGFITTTSCGPDSRYEVVAKFKTIQEMQAFHRALINCGRAVREMGEPDESASNVSNAGSVGPFSHDAGGGKRNIRGTNSLT